MHSETEQNGSDKTGGPAQSPCRSDAYPFPLDAVVLAGTHQNPKRLIAGRNKAFLRVGGKVLIRYMVDALLAAERVGQIFVVGPAEELLEEPLVIQSLASATFAMRPDYPYWDVMSEGRPSFIVRWTAERRVHPPIITSSHVIMNRDPKWGPNPQKIEGLTISPGVVLRNIE